MQNEEFIGDFVVIPGISFDIILGEDILSNLKAKINLEERTIEITGKNVSIIEKIKGINENGKEAKINMVGKSTKRYNLNNNNENQGECEINKVNYINEYETCNNKLPEKLNINCPSEYKETIVKIIEKYISLINYTPRIAKGYVHKINVDESKPFKCKTYPIPYNYRKQVKHEIDTMLQSKIIESAQTNFINPLVIVKKKNNEIRLCLDARNLNSITKSQYDAPQNLQSMLSCFGKNTIFTKLDLKNSFWLIPLAVESRKYTGFSVDGHVYQFRVVPYGLQSSASSLVRTMQSILDQYEQFCFHYIDDILIFSESVREHMSHIEIILKALDIAGLKLNIEKCEFCKVTVKYLGYKINQTGISIDKDRINEIKNYPRPTNLKTLRGFLGIMNYYKKFIPRLSELEVPLIELLRKENKWKWDDRREQAFITIKQNFHSELLLYSPNFKLPFTLRTDASDNIVAAELIQVQEGIEIPICFISRILKPYERRYSISEKEMLAIVFAITKLKFFLIGSHFTLETDHIALCYLMKNKFANNRIYRWSLLIQEFSFTIMHRPGKENITADALTRNKLIDKHENKTYTIALNLLSQTEPLYAQENILESQDVLTDLRQILEERNMYKGCSIKNEYIIKTIQNEEKYVIHEDLTKVIISDLHHRFDHVGVRKTWLIFRENFYCKHDYQLTKRVIQNCHECCIGKNKNHKNYNVVNSIVTSQNLEIIAIDYVSNLIQSEDGNKNIFVITDNFSKYIKAYPTKRCNMKTSISKLNQFINEVGKPVKILADNATYFNNDKFIGYWEKKNIHVIFTTIRHPKANPAERYIQEILRFLRLAKQERHTDWDKYLPRIINHINNTPHTITGISPITVMMGQHPHRPWTVETDNDLIEIQEKVRNRLKINAERYTQRENKRIKKRVKFKINDLVVLKRLRYTDKSKMICGKLMYPYEGPYVINKILNENTYELKHIESELIRGKFHVELLYVYTPELSLNN